MDARAPDRDFTHLSPRDFSARFIDELHLEIGRHLPAGADRRVWPHMVRRVQHRDGERRFGLAIILGEDRPPARHRPFQDRARHRRGAIDH